MRAGYTRVERTSYLTAQSDLQAQPDVTVIPKWVVQLKSLLGEGTLASLVTNFFWLLPGNAQGAFWVMFGYSE